MSIWKGLRLFFMATHVQVRLSKNRSRFFAYPPRKSAPPWRAKSFAIALLLAAMACVYLGFVVHASRSTQVVDEAVHSIDGLRLYNDLHNGHPGDFLVHTYFSERWQPPVNDHLRWYPFVHSWLETASFLVFGPSDFSARLPSLFCLFGSCVLFYLIAWRIAPERRGWSGLLAVVLLLTAPNMVSFMGNGLIESAIFFMCYLSLLTYLRFDERRSSRGRAVVAGLALAAALLTKYDHGMVLAVSLGLNELMVAKWRPTRLLRSGTVTLFGTAAAVLAVWFAHPAKVAALLDASAVPFSGRPYLMLANYATTWFLEYSTSPLIGLLMVVALVAVYRYRHDPAVRAVWVFAAFSTLFLMSRGRFRYRYNIVEAPAALLLLAAFLPAWLRAAREKLRNVRTAVGAWAVALGAVGLGLASWWAVRPDALFNRFTGLFERVYEMNSRHWGLQQPAQHYMQFFIGLKPAFHDLALMAALMAAAVLIAGCAIAARRAITAALIAALLVTWVPGAARLYAQAPELIDWDIAGVPQLHAIYDFVEQHTPRRGDILLAGGWNQISNNSLRWYLLTGYGQRDFDDVHVVGATIGTIVLPTAPRVAYWARQMAEAPAGELPESMVVIEPESNFLYNVDMEQDVTVYRRVLEVRKIYTLAAEEDMPALGCRVEVYRLNPNAPPAPAHVDATLPEPVPVGKKGLIDVEDAWRGYWDPQLHRAS